MIKDIPVLALTPGEPAGIGPECTIRLAHQHPELRLLAVADPQLLIDAADTLGVNVPVVPWQPGDTVSAGKISCFPQSLATAVHTGVLDPANAKYVLATITSAVSLVVSGHAGALVTGPVQLAELAGVEKVVMMLAADKLRVALVTTHLPLRNVADAISRDNVRKTIRITHHELGHRFDIKDPSIQVLGLNPHAGEGGHLGHEDEQIIQKAIDDCRQEGINAFGPVPADTAFTPPRLETCDAVIAMYHDQGLPVLKHAGFGNAVNITLGLPFIRTSVDHGTALDIAGKNQADASSMYVAAMTAREMCQ